MKIGFDIDDTITYCRKFELDNFIQWSKIVGRKQNISKEIYDRTEYDAKKRFHLSDDEFKNFNNFHFPKMVNEVPVMKRVRPLIVTLNKFGIETCIITRRDPNYDKSEYKGSIMVNDTKNWLRKNDIQISELHFGCLDKDKSCKEFDVHLLFEDSPANINAVSKLIPVIVPAYPYNIFEVDLNENIAFTNIENGYTDEVFDLMGKLLYLDEDEVMHMKSYFNSLKFE